MLAFAFGGAAQAADIAPADDGPPAGVGSQMVETRGQRNDGERLATGLLVSTVPQATAGASLRYFF